MADTKQVPITQDMLTAAGEPVEAAYEVSDIKGILFLRVLGDAIRLYNPGLKQAMKRTFTSLPKAREFCIAKLTDRVVN